MTLHLSRRVWACAVGLALVPLLTPPAPAQEILALNVVRVEEDWELQVDQPDANSNCPQVSCTMSPFGDLSGLHAVFELNHRSQPTFEAGGMQLQIWDGERAVSSRKFPSYVTMQTGGEVVRWTQVIKLESGSIIFEIVGGTSTTWSNFGGQGYLRFQTASGLSNLNSYDPNVSIANSSVGFGANRVRYLAMRRLRIVLADGTTVEDETTRVAHAVN